VYCIVKRRVHSGWKQIEQKVDIEDSESEEDAKAKNEEKQTVSVGTYIL
jgi:hypothetical protein